MNTIKGALGMDPSMNRRPLPQIQPQQPQPMAPQQMPQPMMQPQMMMPQQPMMMPQTQPRSNVNYMTQQQRNPNYLQGR